MWTNGEGQTNQLSTYLDVFDWHQLLMQINWQY